MATDPGNASPALRLDPIRPPVPFDPEWEEEGMDEDMEIIERAALFALSLKGGVAKSLSPSFGSRSRRRNQLVARLKRARNYPAPVRGGTGAQARTRRRKF